VAPTSSIGSEAGSKTKNAAAAKAAAASASFGMNMPLMSSAFDTAMWLSAA
jgi:hypothetical protein